MSIEYLLARLTAQTSFKDPRITQGGVAELTAADISVIAAAAPHMSFHALMAKYCDDHISEKAMLKWMQKKSLQEWFSNPAYATIRIEAGQFNKLAELAVLAWINPQLPHGAMIASRAAYIGANHETFRRSYQPHYAFLSGELSYLEAVGLTAIRKFRGFRDSPD